MTYNEDTWYTHHSVRAHLVLLLLLLRFLRCQRSAAGALLCQERLLQLGQVLLPHKVRVWQLRHRHGDLSEGMSGWRRCRMYIFSLCCFTAGTVHLPSRVRIGTATESLALR